MLDGLLRPAVERPDHVQRGEAQPVLPAAHGGVCQPGASFAHIRSSMPLLTAEIPAFLTGLHMLRMLGAGSFSWPNSSFSSLCIPDAVLEHLPSAETDALGWRWAN